MTDLLLLFAAAAVVAAYVCRFDPLSWRRTPGLMLAHIVGAVPAFWVLKIAALDIVQPVHVAVLAGSAVLLAVLYPRMPKPPGGPAGAPAPVEGRHLEGVSGGAKPPEPRP